MKTLFLSVGSYIHIIYIKLYVFRARNIKSNKVKVGNLLKVY